MQKVYFFRRREKLKIISKKPLFVRSNDYIRRLWIIIYKLLIIYEKNCTFCEGYFVADLAAISWATENPKKLAFSHRYKIPVNSFLEKRNKVPPAPLKIQLRVVLFVKFMHLSISSFSCTISAVKHFASCFCFKRFSALVSSGEKYFVAQVDIWSAVIIIEDCVKDSIIWLVN